MSRSAGTVNLLAWGATNGRELPWRHTRDPWLVLMSEVMCQQTQAERVAVRWPDFCERFATPAAMASVGLSEIVRAWEGLGYPRRARNLHTTAAAIVEHHNGRVPDRLEALLALPGIGPYTARAVLAFAFEHPVAVVDTNVGRVLSRRAGRAMAATEMQAYADRLVPAVDAWGWNQAMIDLGALVCTARSARCERCPVRRGCRWRGLGPDPSTTSFGVSARQARFDGSDRQGRGRLLRAVAAHPVRDGELATVMGWDNDRVRAERVAATLLADALVATNDGIWTLPGERVC
jgi:A/G-specific adenine glycosylase